MVHGLEAGVTPVVVHEIKDITRRKEVLLGDHFVRDLKCDSLDLIEIVMSMEERFGIEIGCKDGDLVGTMTVQDLANYIEHRLKGITWP